ncbi:MAG: S41 family peptidase [Arenicellales bacterium]|nr:S41 family peptidase [Arenicellales bacterium]
MNRSGRYILILCLGMFLGTAITMERAVFAERADTQPLPLDTLRIFTEVFGKVKSDYVESVGDKKLLEDAIHGMLAGLDPHSSYLNPESFKEMRIGTEGKFGGLGIEVTMENGFVKVVAPIDDTPAQRAGLKAGDLITRLDGTPVKGMTLNDAVKKMRGEPDTDITLTVVREGEPKPLEFVITRAIIRITSVKGTVLEPGYAYVRVSQFQSGTADALRRKISNLKKESDGKLKGLILDLRNNPGGVLNGAVSVSDMFLTDGVIVSTKGRLEDSRVKYTATPNDYLKDAPMVVLVNGGSASASEIVAGALQDHGRAIIMGTKTFGKGSVQTILPINNGAALKITTARYYTPEDRSIQATGIVPDVVVEDLQVTKRGTDPDFLRESNLQGHLESEVDGDGGSNANDVSADTTGPNIEDDFQLREALNLLKGVNIVRNQTNN